MDKIRVYHLTELRNRRRDLRQRSTEVEKILWGKLRNNKIGVKFRRQFSVMGYVIDFYCPKHKLAVEIDGEIHKTTKKYDEYRTKYLSAFGITVVRFNNEDVENNVESVVGVIQSRLSDKI
ncbi:MAG: endonuclease domain-containing protein [Patescibacteria group bacterium]